MGRRAMLSPRARAACPAAEAPNEIVFCERCDLAVHQACYDIPQVPSGARLPAFGWACGGGGSRKDCSRTSAQSNDIRFLPVAQWSSYSTVYMGILCRAS